MPLGETCEHCEAEAQTSCAECGDPICLECGDSLDDPSDSLCPACADNFYGEDEE